MIEYTLFAKNQGCGYVADNPDDYRKLPGYRTETVQIGDEVLKPGVSTDCSGFFRRDVKYLGMVEENGLLFLIGGIESLFPEYLYQVVYRVTQTRIYENFGNGFGRDFNYKGGQWK